MLHSPPVSSSLSPAIATSLPTNVVNLTASINGSPTISTRSYPQSASRPLLKQSNENKILLSRYIMELAVFWTKRLRAVTRTRRWMSLSAKLSRSLSVFAPSTHVCSWLPPSAKITPIRLRGFWFCSPWPSGSHRRRYRRGHALAQRLIYFSTHPEAVQQDGQLPGHRYRRSLLRILPAALAEPQPISS